MAKRTLVVEKGAQLKAMKIDVNDCIDALPVLAVLGCYAEGETELFNGAVARHKESDRIAAICSELKKMGARIEEKSDGLIVKRSDLQGAALFSHHDHRIAQSLTVAAMGAKGASRIGKVECIAKTNLAFFEDFCALGAKMER